MKQTYYKLCLDYFNSQPHKEADPFLLWQYAVSKDFNSQPHKEADAYLCSVRSKRFISTHSLTRRLTAISDKNIFIQN